MTRDGYTIKDDGDLASEHVDTFTGPVAYDAQTAPAMFGWLAAEAAAMLAMSAEAMGVTA